MCVFLLLLPLPLLFYSLSVSRSCLLNFLCKLLCTIWAHKLTLNTQAYIRTRMKASSRFFIGILNKKIKKNKSSRSFFAHQMKFCTGPTEKSWHCVQSENHKSPAIIVYTNTQTNILTRFDISLFSIFASVLFRFILNHLRHLFGAFILWCLTLIYADCEFYLERASWIRRK